MAVQNVVGEGKAVVVEVLDGFFNELFGFHILEPMITYEERLKVKPQIRATKPQAEALNYMKKVEKKVIPIEEKANEFSRMSAQ